MTPKETSDAIVSWIGLIAVIVGGVLGFIEYFNQREEARITITLKFLERSYQPPIKDAFKIVDRAWTDAIPTQNKIWDQDNKTQDEKENQWRVFVLSLNKDISTSTMTVINFYEEIGICVYNDICDRVVAFEIFGKMILTFYNQNYHYIMYLRQRLNNHRFAHRMEVFVKSYINYQKESNRLEKNTGLYDPVMASRGDGD